MSDAIVGGSPPPDGNRNLGPLIISVNWVVFSLSWVSLILRVISRVWVSHNFGWDDAMMIFCQVTNSVGMGLVVQEIFWGLGRHRFYIKQVNYIGFLKYDYLDWCQVFLTLLTCKLAIAMFLLRISKFKKWRKFLYGLIIFLICSHIPILFVYIFQCKPVRKVWSPQNPPGVCYTKKIIQDIIIVQGVCSILTDVVLAAFPIVLLRDMRLPKRQKLALQLLMGLGFITAIACTIRTAFSYEVKADDKTWQGIPNALCRIFEINLAIIAANAPMMRPLWNIGRRKWRERFNRTADTSTGATPASRLEWYRPTQKPWYRAIGNNFNWRVRPPVSKTSSTQSMNPKTETSVHAEDIDFPVPPETTTMPTRPPMIERPTPVPRPQTHSQPRPEPRPQPKPKSRPFIKRLVESRPAEWEKPENVTWAKKEPEPKKDQSFDLPIQGSSKNDWEEEEKAKMRERGIDWGGYNFRRQNP